MNSAATSPQSVLQFWFEELEPAAHWRVDAELDGHIKKRFLATLDAARCGELYDWRANAQGRLAEVIVLDQFSRNIHRGTPLAFAQDALALVLAQEAVAGGVLDDLSDVQRPFLLMPYMHSESAIIHAAAEPLFQVHTGEGSLRFEQRHREIIDRFGRYPHRNAILGRASSADELAFLEQPGSSF